MILRRSNSIKIGIFAVLEKRDKLDFNYSTTTMETNAQQNTDLNSGNLIVFFYKWRKPLLIVTITAILCSVVVSLIIENKYKSTVVLFPSTTSSISKALLSEDLGRNVDILQLGEEEEAEQMLQILNSDEIRNRIIEKYNLRIHYDIDEDDEYKFTKLQKEYEDNVSFERTKFMSVEINVLDHNADTAAAIANDIAALLDTVNNRMRREVAIQALKIIEDELIAEKEYIKILEDSLKVFTKMGIIDVELQAERLTEQMATAILQGKESAAEKLNKKIELLGNYAGIFNDVKNEIWSEKKRLVILRDKYRATKVDVEKNLQHKFIVNNAFPAEKKSYPIRWLIVLVSTFSSFLLTLIFLLFVESIKSTNFE